MSVWEGGRVGGVGGVRGGGGGGGGLGERLGVWGKEVQSLGRVQGWRVREIG